MSQQMDFFFGFVGFMTCIVAGAAILLTLVMVWVNMLRINRLEARVDKLETK